MSESPSYRLRCLIEGESVVFTVPVAGSAEVGELKELIRRRREKDTLKDVGSDILELWKVNVSNPINATPKHTLVERILLLGDNLSKFATEMEPTYNVLREFPHQPSLEYVHIIVKVPETAAGQNHGLYDVSDYEPKDKQPRRDQKRGSDDVFSNEGRKYRRIDPVLGADGKMFNHTPSKPLAEVRNSPPSGLIASDSTESRLSDAAKDELIELPASHPFLELWALSWKSKTYKPFNNREVRRDNTSDVHVPSTCWVLEVNDWMKELEPRSSVSGVLVRDEYREALYAVVDHFKTGNSNFPTTIDDEDETAMEVDIADPFVNPFLGLSEHFVSEMVAFILIGHPGIGKTTWLIIVLILRLIAGLPTILQTRPNRLYYFDNNGVYKLKYTVSIDASEFKTRFAPSTWCLVDANVHVTTIPSFIYELRLFIVQASSPRAERVDWYKKESTPVPFYFMKPWTIPELITGRTLQKKPQSEAALESFYNRFGPSARWAYSYASDLPHYERSLRANLGVITCDVLFNLVNQATSLHLADAVSHQIILIGPSSTRDDFNVTIPTRHVYKILRNALNDHVLEAAAWMFNLFNRSAKLRGSSGYMLDDAIHLAFSKGGEWTVTPLKANPPGKKNTHWKDPDPDTIPQYLQIGYQGIISINNNPLPGDATFDALTVRSYLRGASITLEDGYYCPCSDSEPTLDSFLYESAIKTASILQSSVSPKHGVDPKGFEWLQGLGVEKFRYIYISCPGEHVDLPFPNHLSRLNIHKYSLVITQYPT